MKRILLSLLICMMARLGMAQYTQLTNIPTIYIETFNKQAVTSKSTYIYATLTYIDGNTMMQYDSLQIRGRGNSTWNLAKKPYRIKFKESTKFLGKGFALPHKDHVGGTRGFSGIYAVLRGGRRVLFSTGDGGTAHVPLQDARVAGPARADDSGDALPRRIFDSRTELHPGPVRKRHPQKAPLRVYQAPQILHGKRHLDKNCGINRVYRFSCLR